MALGDFFTALREDIDETVIQHGPGTRFPAVEVPGLTDIPLATLAEIMRVGTFEDIYPQIAPASMIAEGGHAGVFAIPAGFRDALADLADANTIADEWAATEELVADRWTAEDALSALRAMVRHAEEARAAGQDMWYWWVV